jgi:glutamine amidotransferase
MSNSVTIVDYGMGNMHSVIKAIEFLGYTAIVSNTPQEIISSNMLILPGVGSFGRAMHHLKIKGIDEALIEVVTEKRKKILGICLGMQLLFEFGEEDGGTAGLSLVAGTVGRFDDRSMKGLQIPHIGFNSVNSGDDSLLFKKIPAMSDFYFVHSFRITSLPENGCISTAKYGDNFIAAYEHKNIFCTQFHPEKSQTNGLILLKNFLNS